MVQRKPVRIYVTVDVRFNANGEMRPHIIFWENGSKYEIDRITDVCPLQSSDARRHGDRYTVWIRGKQRYLFFERYGNAAGNNLGRWFVERKAA